MGQTARSPGMRKKAHLKAHIIIIHQDTPLRGTTDGRKCRLKLIGTAGPVESKIPGGAGHTRYRYCRLSPPDELFKFKLLHKQ